MSRKEKKYHFIYKTTDTRNENYYIGMHSTDNLNDGYVGSGTRLKKLIYKHGKIIFKLEILEHLPDRESLIKREIEIVNSDLLKEEKCMNLKPGGSGGFCNEEHQKKFFGGNKQIPKSKRKESRNKQDIFWGKNPKLYVNYCSKLSLRMKGNKIGEGRKLSDKTKNKIGSKNSIKQSGTKNSQFGTCWITNGTLNKKIKKNDFHLYEKDKWFFGRS